MVLTRPRLGAQRDLDKGTDVSSLLLQVSGDPHATSDSSRHSRGPGSSGDGLILVAPTEESFVSGVTSLREARRPSRRGRRTTSPAGSPTTRPSGTSRPVGATASSPSPLSTGTPTPTRTSPVGRSRSSLPSLFCVSEVCRRCTVLRDGTSVPVLVRTSGPSRDASRAGGKRVGIPLHSGETSRLTEIRPSVGGPPYFGGSDLPGPTPDETKVVSLSRIRRRWSLPRPRSTGVPFRRPL